MGELYISNLFETHLLGGRGNRDRRLFERWGGTFNLAK